MSMVGISKKIYLGFFVIISFFLYVCLSFFFSISRYSISVCKSFFMSSQKTNGMKGVTLFIHTYIQSVPYYTIQSVSKICVFFFTHLTTLDCYLSSQEDEDSWLYNCIFLKTFKKLPEERDGKKFKSWRKIQLFWNTLYMSGCWVDKGGLMLHYCPHQRPNRFYTFLIINVRENKYYGGKMDTQIDR